MAKQTATSTPNPSASAPTPSTSDLIERDLAQSALRKRQTGATPNSRETAALRKYEKKREEQQRWQFYRSIPKKHWREMSGRQAKILNEQAELYGAPIGEATIDLPAFVRWFHKFLATNGRKLLSDDPDDPMLSGENSPALEKWREEKWKLARFDRLERAQILLPRQKVHDALNSMASILRTLGEKLSKRYGDEAHTMLDEALSDFEREIGSIFPSDDSNNPNHSEPPAKP